MGHNLKQTLYEGDWLRLVRIGHWESCERTHGQGMAVIVIAVTPADEVLFVEQYRVPLGARTIEMPAGLVGDDHKQDTLVDAARRELIEETGWSPARVDVLLVGPTSAGMSDEWVTFVRATGLRHVSAGGGDSSEDISVHRVPLAGVDEWIESRLRGGTPIDPKIYTALYWLRYGQPNIESA